MSFPKPNEIDVTPLAFELIWTAMNDYLKYFLMEVAKALAIFSWKSDVLSSRSSSLLVMKAVSTSTEGMPGSFNTIKLAWR